MKKLFIVLLMVGLIAGVGATNAFAMPSYWDLTGLSGNYGGDADAKTRVFNALQYFANTTSTQYDTDGSLSLSVGDVFVDKGNAVITALLPTALGNTEGLNENYQVTMVWTDLTGHISEINPGATTDTVTTVYTGGTIDFYFDYSYVGNALTNADFGTTVAAGDDSEFTNGIKVATVSNIYGTGHSNFVTGSSPYAFTGGDYSLWGQFTFMYDDFWFDENGNDLLEKYVDLGWLLGYTAGDTDQEHFVQNPGTYPVLYTIDSDHDSSFEISAVPEPTTLMLLGFGLIGIAFQARRKMEK